MTTECYKSPKCGCVFNDEKMEFCSPCDERLKQSLNDYINRPHSLGCYCITCEKTNNLLSNEMFNWLCKARADSYLFSNELPEVSYEYLQEHFGRNE